MAKSKKYIASGSSGGVGICTVLFLIFLVLKLTGTITWSWWWVTAPLWAPFVAFLTLCVLVFVVGLFIGLVKAIINYVRGKN